MNKNKDSICNFFSNNPGKGLKYCAKYNLDSLLMDFLCKIENDDIYLDDCFNICIKNNNFNAVKIIIKYIEKKNWDILINVNTEYIVDMLNVNTYDNGIKFLNFLMRKKQLIIKNNLLLEKLCYSGNFELFKLLYVYDKLYFIDLLQIALEKKRYEFLNILFQGNETYDLKICIKNNKYIYKFLYNYCKKNKKAKYIKKLIDSDYNSIIKYLTI